MPISAQIVADSISPSGKRITTLAVEFPTFLIKELNTHRAFSRSYMSSRAVPVQTMLKRVQDHPFIPIHWGKNQKGMSAQEECSEPINVKYLNKGGQDESHPREVAWKTAALQATIWAGAFTLAGYHKQLVNRLLEPFSYTSGVITSTEWDNFFSLRISPAAQPEIQELARKMKEAMEGSTPTSLGVDQWHLPFVDQEKEAKEIYRVWYASETLNHPFTHIPIIDLLKKVSVARCARVSYQANSRTKTFTLEEDLALYERLIGEGHWSPAEHQAQPMLPNEYRDFWEDGNASPGVTHVDRKGQCWSGNFCQWVQFRQLLVS